MGKGDIKSKRGKISSGSYGVRRKKKKTRAYVAPAVAEKPAAKAIPAAKKKSAAKPAAKKTTAKKPAAKKAASKKATTKKASAKK